MLRRQPGPGPTQPACCPALAHPLARHHSLIFILERLPLEVLPVARPCSNHTGARDPEEPPNGPVPGEQLLAATQGLGTGTHWHV